ncbi:armadillo repeat-containing protein 3 [Limanda limanda]|uniref:armadillo repeat-containing protein 3 n=1 Tax=Limanda limanda TaxID=27771 RepID=UPI0029C847C0|nr:armadillo repeat-containing protein 3 [Limanda limanda]
MGKKGKKKCETPSKDKFEALPFEGKTPQTVVLLLSSPEEDILIKASETIYVFAEKGDENKVSLLGFGALEPLCRLIAHNNVLIRRNAIMALGTMAVNGDVTVALKKTDVIPSIIERLSPEEDRVVQEFATLCLASLSPDFVCKAQIFDNKGLPPLIQLLSSPDPDVQKNSVEIIFNLVQDYQCRVAVHELGGIAPLLELLKSDFPIIQRLALETLMNVTTDKDTCNTFSEEQGFEKTMEILNNKDLNDLHAEALHVLANYLSDSERVHLIHQGGGLATLMDFFLTPNSSEIQSIAVKCITRLAQSSENQKMLHEQNVEKVLVDYLSAADASVKTATCKAVAAMNLHLASKERFRELGGIPALVKALKVECVELIEAASHVLADLTHNNHLSNMAVYKAGGHAILVQQLQRSCPKTVANAAATLCNMAQQEAIRNSILSHGVIQALVEPLKSTDTQVLVNTTLCLAALACDEEDRAELLSAGGLQPLVNLLRSYHKEVLQSACLAVIVCASDEPTSVEMCKFGAVELLQEINQSVKRRSSFSESAMISLLKYNLSVKYSLTDHLTSTDVVSDGFYDAGKAHAGQRILTLEEFSKQPVNQQRPIIAVNTAIEQRQESDHQQEDVTQSVSPAEKPWKMVEDVSLQVLVKETKDYILSLDDEREQCAALARMVSEAMGGAVEMEKMHAFPWVLHLSELKIQLQSNVIPIGLITRGIYRHRALLFKCLADCIGMSCTMVRGEYDRAWNEVLLFGVDPSSGRRSLGPSRFIVDLMHRPERLLAVNTPAAVQYQYI